ncbi:MAG: TrmH family RNA methyltransferase [Gemmatimonadales bacterium]
MAHSVETLIRDLRLRRGRERRGLALAEGVRLVEEAVQAGIGIRLAAVAPALEGTPRGRALKVRLEAAGVELHQVDDRALAGLADTEHPQGIVAVIEPRTWSLEQVPLGARAVVLVLDGVQDPGNVGTMIRTALGLGTSAVVALKGTAELTSPKVLRATMGAVFRLPCVASDDETFLPWAARHHLGLWLADAGGTSLRSWRPTRPLALVVGNEGAGVRDTLAGVAAGRVGIPLQPGAESLNVAVAAGILLYEVRDVV